MKDRLSRISSRCRGHKLACMPVEVPYTNALVDSTSGDVSGMNYGLVSHGIPFTRPRAQEASVFVYIRRRMDGRGCSSSQHLPIVPRVLPSRGGWLVEMPTQAPLVSTACIMSRAFLGSDSVSHRVQRGHLKVEILQRWSVFAKLFFLSLKEEACTIHRLVVSRDPTSCYCALLLGWDGIGPWQCRLVSPTCFSSHGSLFVLAPGFGSMGILAHGTRSVGLGFPAWSWTNVVAIGPSRTLCVPTPASNPLRVQLGGMPCTCPND